MRVSGATFIVSGGSSGLGLATTQHLLDLGAYISVLDLSEPDYTSDCLKYFQADVTKLEEIERAVDGTVAWTKETGAPLRGVIASAGVGTAAKMIDASGEPHSLDVWDFALAVNLTGTFNLTRLALKHIVQTPPDGPDDERGLIIFASSSAAFDGQPGQVAYAATKGALASMVLPLARDLARFGVRAVAIAPGVFASAMTDNMSDKAKASMDAQLVFPRRFGKAGEFAETVRWAIECAYVNGETIRLSGAGRLPARL